MTQEEGRARISALVANFRRGYDEYRAVGYNETQARADFITPLIEALGWDIANLNVSLSLREVVQEANVDVGDDRPSKKPDYEVRLARERKFFVEAKKPNVRIERSREAAFQTRRYGYSANLPVSVLTNFDHVVVYDCTVPPRETDDSHVARLAIFNLDDIVGRFGELWGMLSRESVASGSFDRRFEDLIEERRTSRFDGVFLQQVRDWRIRLATDIHRRTPVLTNAQLTFMVHRFIVRLVFLRMCEDRDLDTRAPLSAATGGDAFQHLMRVTETADSFYNSGLFRVLDDAPLGASISNECLHQIIQELYYPQSPYTFAVVEAEVLGTIYEQFLGETIQVENGVVQIVSKPEVRESGGVVPDSSRILVGEIML